MQRSNEEYQASAFRLEKTTTMNYMLINEFIEREKNNVLATSTSLEDIK